MFGLLKIYSINTKMMKKAKKPVVQQWETWNIWYMYNMIDMYSICIYHMYDNPKGFRCLKPGKRKKIILRPLQLAAIRGRPAGLRPAPPRRRQAGPPAGRPPAPPEGPGRAAAAAQAVRCGMMLSEDRSRYIVSRYVMSCDTTSFHSMPY